MKKVCRDSNRLIDLPNIGKSIAADLQAIGIERPQQLCRQNPLSLYEKINQAHGCRQDPCVLDVLMAAVNFMEGGPARPWWTFTAERKRKYHI